MRRLVLALLALSSCTVYETEPEPRGCDLPAYCWYGSCDLAHGDVSDTVVCQIADGVVVERSCDLYSGELGPPQGCAGLIDAGPIDAGRVDAGRDGGIDAGTCFYGPCPVSELAPCGVPEGCRLGECDVVYAPSNYLVCGEDTGDPYQRWCDDQGEIVGGQSCSELFPNQPVDAGP